MLIRLIRLPALLMCLALPLPALAQTAQIGQITGRIQDERGVALPGVAVDLVSEARGFTRATTTDARGSFRFAALAPGRYRLRASHDGFATVTAQGNVVEARGTTTVAITLRAGTADEDVTVMGATPILDGTNAAATTRIREDLIEGLPGLRHYEPRITLAPGVVGSFLINAHGALDGDNLFLIGGVNTTDPSEGTLGTNLYVEGIQEIDVTTSGASAAWGGAPGAIVNVVLKAGGNRFSGSARYLVTNDAWNPSNTTTSEVTGASLARIRFDQVNTDVGVAGGGPILTDRAWFFGTYARSRSAYPPLQTVGPIPEDYQHHESADFWTLAVSGRFAPAHNLGFRYIDSGRDGYVDDYFGSAAEREALTATAVLPSHWAVQYSGVFGSSLMGELTFADVQGTSRFVPFEPGSLHGGAPHFSLVDQKWYNGGAHDSFTDRQRRQATGAATWFAALGDNSHSVTAGFDWQRVRSTTSVTWPTGTLYVDESFDQLTRVFVPNSRFIYDVTGPSTSESDSVALYISDAFEAGDRLSLEAGLRFEMHAGTNDAGAGTIDATTISPRLSGTYDVRGDGRTLVAGSYGRFHDRILQAIPDAFPTIPQGASYTADYWDGAAFVTAGRFEADTSAVATGVGLDPAHVDEMTIGVQQQVGRSIGIGARYVWREWGNIIDDVWVFEGTTPVRRLANLADAERGYRGLEFSFDKTFSNSWSGRASYTWSKTRGNHFSNTFTTLGDFVGADCRVVGDSGVGDDGIIPCSDVSINLDGSPAYGYPHNVELVGVYSRPVGPMHLTAGLIFTAVTKEPFTKTGVVETLLPGTAIAAATPALYLYEPRGSDRVSGLAEELSVSFEATFRPYRTTSLGLRAEVFNALNNQEKQFSSSTAWCSDSTTVACTAARDSYGLASTRADFLGPRRYQFSAVLRF